MLADEGMLLIKFWFHLSKAGQKKRLKELEGDPRTSWRVTERDWRFYRQYDRYREVATYMLRHTSTGDAPWFVMEVSACRMETRREILLVCERGIASLDDALAEHITIVPRVGLKAPLQTERRPIGSEMPLRRELELFVGYLKGGPPPLTPLAEGVEMVELLARMRESAGLPR